MKSNNVPDVSPEDVEKIAKAREQWKELIADAAKKNMTIADLPKPAYSFLEELGPRWIQFLQFWDDVDAFEKHTGKWGKRFPEFKDEYMKDLVKLFAADCAEATVLLFGFGKVKKVPARKDEE